MGTIKHFSDNPYADLKAKHPIFLAIPANLLLWGCKTWVLQQSQINQLNTLKIKIEEAKDNHITNKRVQKISFNIPDVETSTTIRQMDYLEKTEEEHHCHGKIYLLDL